MHGSGRVQPDGTDPELWRTPRDNASGGIVNARSGVQVAELNAEVASRIYQNVCLIAGEPVNWRFSHRGRGSATTHDQMEFKIGATSTIVRVGTTNNGSFLAPVVSQGTAQAPVNVAGNATWVDYRGNFSYAGATGVTNMGFEAIGGSTSGNLLDDIQIELAPFVEFIAPSSSTPESASNNRPTLRVNGTVYTAFNITVQITGGTATIGTDYTTPDNSTTLTINVPAGNYDGASSGSLFPLPVTIVNDTVSEPNETIEFLLPPQVGQRPHIALRPVRPVAPRRRPRGSTPSSMTMRASASSRMPPRRSRSPGSRRSSMSSTPSSSTIHPIKRQATAWLIRPAWIRTQASCPPHRCEPEEAAEVELQTAR